MRCHYEILGIGRDADDADIKTAYRKLALRWHPDKNLDDPAKAKEQFQLVQQAYEVLSDRHERAWYDNHREQILKGGRNSNDYEDTCLDVFQYFTVTCFDGYNDEPGGFYDVYSKVFETIAAEDVDFMDEEEFDEVPKFGSSTSDYNEVVGPFYAYWQSYCTKRSYAWLCPYNVSEIKDRRSLREIDKEMKKIVQQAKKERNEEVRSLVSFVRKRDERVKEYNRYLKKKAALNREKQEINRLEQIRKRKQEIEESKKLQDTKLNGDYEEQLKLLEREYGVSDDEDESINNDENCSENDDDALSNSINLNDDTLYCVVCNREFKNQKSFQNHETSKKHRENIKSLKDLMLEEEEEIQGIGDNYDDDNDDDEEISIIGSTEREHIDTETELDNNDINNEAEEDVIVKTSNKQQNRKSKKSKKFNNFTNYDDIDENPILIDLQKECDNHDNNDDDWSNKKSNGKKSKSKKGNQQQQLNVLSVNENNSVNGTSDFKANSSRSLSKNDKSKIKSSSLNQDRNEIDLNHICVTCKSTFESKNKLFQHLKKTNHGVYIPKVTANNHQVSHKKTNRK